eukprot:TRINITY_DN4728_c0_g1_i1.p1 TRINITY_DN4728_c0_g1~~TRINITY_DN4728_c0_g1_i1.p1  ORF type:complete len:912 (+),score=183.29 TRINITY_DN4728_c0_g1_i1:134-2869(+)
MAAEDVAANDLMAGVFERDLGDVYAGSMAALRGSFGFITEDGTNESMFVMPNQCEAFGGAMPPIGTRVCYQVVQDQKTGRPRAHNVQPEEVLKSAMEQEGALLEDPFEAEAKGGAEANVELVGSTCRGTMKNHKGNYGFITQDDNEENMFCLNKCCEGEELPPVGTRLEYEVGIDPTTRRARAENVRPCSEDALAPQDTAASTKRQSGRQTGVLTTIDEFGIGFVEPDDGGDELLIQPEQCTGFGLELPPKGTRISYMQGIEEFSGAAQAEDVHPVDDAAGPPPPKKARPTVQKTRPTAQKVAWTGRLSGTFAVDKVKFGFIEQDSSDDAMFVMPDQCSAFCSRFPAVGTRVTYAVAPDPKTGKPRAEDVQPEELRIPQRVAPTTVPAQQAPPQQQQALWPATIPAGESVGYGKANGKGKSKSAGPYVEVLPGVPAEGWRTGVLAFDKGSFGFIHEDEVTNPDGLFVMPNQCTGFGGVFPPVGTRIVFTMGLDPKTARPRAENVHPEEAARALMAVPAPMARGPVVGAATRTAVPQAVGEQWFTGTMQAIKSSGAFGFIEQDHEQEKMFILPAQCDAFGGKLPDAGVRLAFTVCIDAKTGRPRADRVLPEGPLQMMQTLIGGKSSAGKGGSSAGKAGSKLGGKGPGWHSGMLMSDKGKFGFIQPDDGGEPMFIVAQKCQDFGNALPPVGTRLVYTVCLDDKTGKPRADEVHPDLAGVAPQRPPLVGADKGRSKGKDNDKGGNDKGKGMKGGEWHRGVMASDKGAYGFVQPDDGEEKMFILPAQSLGLTLPPVGARVVYKIAIDAKTGRPRCDDVHLEGGGGGKASTAIAVAPSGGKAAPKPRPPTSAPKVGQRVPPVTTQAAEPSMEERIRQLEAERDMWKAVAVTSVGQGKGPVAGGPTVGGKGGRSAYN